MKKLINLNGNAVVLSEIKSISVNEYYHVEPKTNQVKIEFKSRKEFIFNPESENWEQAIFNDVLLVDYPDGNTAVDNFYEIMKLWEDALENDK